MARFPRIPSVPNRAAKGRGRRPADARSLGLEHLDRRQMLSANPLVSFADTGSGLGREINSFLPQTERAWTGALGAIAMQAARPLPAMLAANPTVSLSKGVLTVTGTSAADNLEVRQTGDRIEIVGAGVRQPLFAARWAKTPFTVQDGTVSIQASMVQQIRINSGAGNDTIKVRLADVPANTIGNVSINAGTGNDTVDVNVDAATAQKVFADLGQGTDTLRLQTGVTLASKRNSEYSFSFVEDVNAFPQHSGQRFPQHWGQPPAWGTKDLVPLGYGYGHGSGTLAKWIHMNVELDKAAGSQDPALNGPAAGVPTPFPNGILR